MLSLSMNRIPTCCGVLAEILTNGATFYFTCMTIVDVKCSNGESIHPQVHIGDYNTIVEGFPLSIASAYNPNKYFFLLRFKKKPGLCRFLGNREI